MTAAHLGAPIAALARGSAPASEDRTGTRLLHVRDGTVKLYPLLLQRLTD